MGRGSAAVLLIAVSSGFAACGGSSKREGAGEHGGGSPSTGGTPTGGAGTSAGTATTGGDSSSGSAGVAGNTPSGGNGTGGFAGSSVGGDAMGGTPTGGVGGAPGGGSSGGEGGDGDCVDVCELYGFACCLENVECVSSDAHCVLEVLAADMSVIYDYATLEQRIATLPQDLLASITDADVARATADPGPAGRIELRLTDEAAAAHATALASGLSHPFRVSCNGQALFVGVTYMEQGAAAIQTPVLHVASDEESQLILRIGARQGVWAGLNGGGVPTDAKQRIDRPELRAALCRRGVLDLLQ